MAAIRSNFRNFARKKWETSSLCKYFRESDFQGYSFFEEYKSLILFLFNTYKLRRKNIFFKLFIFATINIRNDYLFDVEIGLFTIAPNKKCLEYYRGGEATIFLYKILSFEKFKILRTISWRLNLKITQKSEIDNKIIHIQNRRISRIKNLPKQ